MTIIQKPIVVQGEQSKDSLGLIHVITGEGNGKTTSAIGLAMRAVGNGYTVAVIQFLKSGGTGELYAAKYLPNFTIEQFGLDAVKEREKAQTSLGDFGKKDTTGYFVFQPDVEEKYAATLGFANAKKLIMSGKYDLIILDEINCVLDKKLIPIENIFAILKGKPKHTEIIMTGRDAPKELYDIVDYVSEIKLIKHPWKRGIKARRGIEY